MLEDERCLRRRATAEDQARRNKLIECIDQLRFVKTRQHAQQLERELPTDNGSDLRDFPATAQSIEASDQ